ncbi:hypothetical protein [Actinomadura mexicana]|nr:hypothetical protein [Actinomadura mexicana]
MRELLLSLEDGSWCTRWWTQQYRSDPEVWETRFDTNAHLFFRVVDDETDGAAEAEFISIEHSQPRDSDEERYPGLGEG